MFSRWTGGEEVDRLLWQGCSVDRHGLLIDSSITGGCYLLDRRVDRKSVDRPVGKVFVSRRVGQEVG